METKTSELAIALLSGSVFVLSAYVIVRFLIRWKRHGMHLLPLHIWTISISYNMIIGSILLSSPFRGLSVYVLLVGLAFGVYSLWVLGRFQIKTTRTTPRRRQDDI